MSFALIAAKQSPPNSRTRSGKRGESAGLGQQRLAASQLLLQHRLQLGVDAFFHLQPDHATAAPPLDRAAEVEDQILRLFLQLDIAVAQHAERRGAAFLEPGEQQRRIALEQRLDRDEARLVPRNPHETRTGRREQHQFAHRFAVRYADQVEDHAQPLVRDERKRVRGVERLGGQDRKDLAAEMILQPLGDRPGDRIGIEDLNAAFAQFAADVVPHGLLAVDQVARVRDDRGELLRRRQPVGRVRLDLLHLLPLEARNPHHEEFVEVGAGNRQEPQPLQKGVRSIARLLHHAPVECQPGKLAIEIAARGMLRRDMVVGDGLRAARHGSSFQRIASGSRSRPAAVNVARAAGIDKRRLRRRLASSSKASPVRRIAR
jgi:hypothetical protein